MAKKKRRHKLHLGAALFAACVLMAVTFCAYMASTSLEDVLEKERGQGVIITHTEKD